MAFRALALDDYIRDMLRPVVPDLERLTRSTSAIWLIQRNPRVGDIHADVERDGLPSSACVKRYVREIRSGDRVVFWLSGRASGVHALGEVAEDGGFRTAAWDDDGHGAVTADGQIRLNLFVDLFDRPVRRAVLRSDPRFADESIIRQPFGANPHRVSAGALDAMLEQVAEAG